MKMSGFKYGLFLIALGTINLQAQNKFKGSYQTDPGVVVELQVHHTNVIVEPWNKNEVAVEAYLEDNDLTDQEKAQMLENWQLDTQGSPSRVSLRSVARGGFGPAMDFPFMDVRPPVMPEMLNPLLDQISRHPMRTETLARLRDMKFDFEAYSRNGDEYLSQWEEEVKERLGDHVKIEVQTWSNIPQDSMNDDRMSQHWQEIQQKMKQHRAMMEERLGQMDQWADNLQRQMQHQSFFFHPDAQKRSGSKSKRTVKLRIPQDARLVIRARHGAVELAGDIKNLKADISYAPFTANKLSGKDTQVRSSYAPVKIDAWEYGELQTSYTPMCEIGTVESLRLSSNSSDLKIGEITDTALLRGTFGKIKVDKVARNFNLLDLNLNNSDLNLQLPDAPLEFAYHGSQSEISYPQDLKVNRTETYDTEILKARHKSGKTNGSVNIRAQYSQVDIYL